MHTVIGTAGNVSDVTQAHALLHGKAKSRQWVMLATKGVEKREENLGKNVTWHVAMKRSKRKALPNNKLGRMTEKLEHLKASVRAKVEHPFHVVKNLFRHRKARYRGLANIMFNCSRCSASPIWCWLAGNSGSQKTELRPEDESAGKNASKSVDFAGSTGSKRIFSYPKNASTWRVVSTVNTDCSALP